MTNYRLNREEVILVIIDLQEKLMKAMPEREKVYKNTQILLKTQNNCNSCDVTEHIKGLEHVQ